MTPSEYTPLSPRILYPRIRGSGLGAAVDVRSQIGMNDGVIAVGEVEESKEIEAETIDVEDVQPQQIMPTPDLPSRAVIEEHRIDHWPPRSWCDECNEGHARERRHGKVPDQHRVVIVSIDYAFVTRSGAIVVEGDPGWNDEQALKFLIVKDSLSRTVLAHAVTKKEVDDKRFAVDIIVDDVLWLGF